MELACLHGASLPSQVNSSTFECLQDNSGILDKINQTAYPVLPFTSKRLSPDDYDFGLAAFTFATDPSVLASQPVSSPKPEP